MGIFCISPPLSILCTSSVTPLLHCRKFRSTVYPSWPLFLDIPLLDFIETERFIFTTLWGVLNSVELSTIRMKFSETIPNKDNNSRSHVHVWKFVEAGNLPPNSGVTRGSWWCGAAPGDNIQGVTPYTGHSIIWEGGEGVSVCWR